MSPIAVFLWVASARVRTAKKLGPTPGGYFAERFHPGRPGGSWRSAAGFSDCGYGPTPLPATTLVVNPAWRQADAAVRKQRATVTRLAADFGAASLPPAPDPDELERFARDAIIAGAVGATLTGRREFRPGRGVPGG